jgi:hypothetical protein
MAKENPWNNSVSRVEYDYRAREARLRLEGLERLLVKRNAVMDFRPVRLYRLLGLSLSATRRSDDQSTASPSDRRPCGMSAPVRAPNGREAGGAITGMSVQGRLDCDDRHYRRVSLSPVTGFCCWWPDRRGPEAAKSVSPARQLA